MRVNIIKLPTNKDLYVRIPSSLRKLGKLKIVLPPSCTDKTIRITVVENTQAPFEDDAIYCDTKSCRLTYFGNRETWEPEECSVEGVTYTRSNKVK